MSDAWRYACVNCGSVSLIRRVEEGGWRCENCGTIAYQRHDKKTGGVVA